MSGDPFPVGALDENRRGRLTAEQARDLGRVARQSRRTGRQVGVVLIGFGAVLIFGGLTGRAGSVVGPLALGVVLVLGGLALLAARGLGRAGRASERAAAGDVAVEIVRGYLRRESSPRGIADQALGVRASPSPDDEWDYYLHVGDRRFPVGREQFDAAPADGFVHAYVLPASDRLVNLEQVGPGHGEVVGQAIASGIGGIRPAAAPTPAWPAPGAPTSDRALRQAVVGRWWNPSLGLVLELREDGVALSGRGRDLEPSQWHVRGAEVLQYAGETFRVRVAADQLLLVDEEGSSLSFQRG
jgi:hypothetical protein